MYICIFQDFSYVQKRCEFSWIGTHSCCVHGSQLQYCTCDFGILCIHIYIYIYTCTHTDIYIYNIMYYNIPKCRFHAVFNISVGSKFWG